MGSIRIPKIFANGFTAGSSGDARIVRCWDGQQYYWAKTINGEIAVSDTRRVQNWIQDRDPVNWVARSTGNGATPVFGSTYLWNGITWREVTLDPGTSGSSYVYTNVALPGKMPVWSSIWLRLPTGAGSKTLSAITASRSANWPYAKRENITINETPKRFVTHVFGEETYIGIHIKQESIHGPITLWVGIDELHCATADICPIPYTGTSFAYAAEVVAPDVNYGFGVPGVAYFNYANSFTVDANGVVTDTGVRTPLGRGGLVLAGSLSNNVAPSYSTSAGGWTPESGVVTWQGVGKSLSGLPAPEGFKGDGVDRYTHISNNNPIALVQGQKVYLHCIIEVVGGSNGEDSECSLRGGSPSVLAQTRLRKGTGVISGASTYGTILYSRYEAGSGPNGGDIYEFVTESVEQATSTTRLFYCFSDHGVASQKTAYVHYACVSVGKLPPINVLLVNSSSSSSASRNGDLSLMSWVTNAGWDGKRRLRAKLVVDTNDIIYEGTVLGGDSQAGAANVSIIRIVYDTNNSDYRIQVSDGSNTWIAPLAIPKKYECNISVDAGSFGARVKIDGTEVSTSNPTFDFSWVSETYLGRKPDGSDDIQLPMKLYLGGY